MNRNGSIQWLVAVLLLAAQLVGVVPAAAAWQPTQSQQVGLSFSGNGAQLVKFDRPFEQMPATAELWVKLPHTGKREVILGNYGTGGVIYSIELTVDGTLRYYEHNGTNASNLYGSRNICDDTWHHIAFTRQEGEEGTAVRFLVDGQEDASDTLPLTRGIAPTNAHYIGRDYRTDYPLRGTVGEIRLWSQVRTDDQIAQFAAADLTGTEPGLAHCYKLDEAFSQSSLIAPVRDSVTGGIDGKASGFSEYKGDFTGAGVYFGSAQDETRPELAAENLLQQTPKTFEAWVNMPKDASGRGGVIAGNYYAPFYGDTPCISFEIYSGGAPRIYWTESTGHNQSYVASGVNVFVGDWVHIAVVRDDGTQTFRCYINGELADEQPCTVTEDTVLLEPFKIGGDYRDGNTMAFQGSIADIRLWSDVRTQQEIADSRNVRLSGREQGLLCSWALDQPAEGVYPDASPLHNHLTPYSEWQEAEFPQGDYRIAVIPDIQVLSESYPEVLSSNFDWLAANAGAYNIKCAIQVGDLTNSNTVAEWERVRDNFAKLDGVLPYFFVPGNHDYGSGVRNGERYNAYLPYSKYAQTQQFGGAFEEGCMENTYSYVTMGGVKYLIMLLEFGPRDAVLDWANQVVSEHPDCRVIVATHANLYYTGELLDESCEAYASGYGLCGGDGNDGDDLWQRFTSRHDNIDLVLSGHISHDDLAFRETTGIYGNTVQHILVDDQGMDGRRKGAGLIALLTFNQGGDVVGVNWYSPSENKLFRAKNQTTLSLAPTQQAYSVAYSGAEHRAVIHAPTGADGAYGVLLAAGFGEDGTMTACTRQTVVFTDAGSQTVTLPEELKQNGTAHVRLFLWDGTEGCRPLCPSGGGAVAG